MAKARATDGRESGTGQDTPLGVCPCPAPLPATPCRTWRDIVPSRPAVTPWVSGAQSKATIFLPPGWLLFCLRLGVPAPVREAA
jgi:hypothetical protein